MLVGLYANNLSQAYKINKYFLPDSVYGEVTRINTNFDREQMGSLSAIAKNWAIPLCS